MRSKINHIIDFRTVPVQWEIDLTCPQTHLDKELHQVVRPYKKVTDVQTVKNGDVVLLKLESELPRFHKPMVPVTVGGGLYDVQLEQQLVGHKGKECFSVTVQEVPVQVSILKISRTEYPEPTDEMVAAYCPTDENYEGITTVSDFYRKAKENYRQRRREDAVYEIMQYLMDHVLTNEPTDIFFDPEEMADLSARMMQESKAEAGNSEMSDQALAEKLGLKDAEALYKEVRASCHWQIGPALWIAHEKGLDAADMELGDERLFDYHFLESYVREHIIYKEEG